MMGMDEMIFGTEIDNQTRARFHMYEKVNNVYNKKLI